MTAKYYLLSLLLLLAACSNIGTDERLIYVEPVATPTDPVDAAYDAPIAEVPRRVLIEDHTGQLCPNCPDATKLIHEFQSTYGDLVVPVAIHSERQGIMEPGGLGNELGNTYYRYWNLQYKPAGLISRIDGGTGKVLDKTMWILALQYVLQQETPLDIRIHAARQASDATRADISVKVICTRPEAAVSGKLQVWVTEDNIVAQQDSMGLMIPDYVHNHVLRAAVNGTWGEDVSVSGSSDDAAVSEFHYTLPISAAWKPADLSIVAFVYTDNEVVQAAQAKLRLNE